MPHTGGDPTRTGLTARVPHPRSPGALGVHGARPVRTRFGKVVVVGMSSVGLPLAVRTAEAGYQVVAHDTDRRRLQALSVRRSYVEEVPDARLRALSDESFLVTSDEAALTGFDIAVIVVPEAPHGEEAAALAYAEAAARTVARYLLPSRAVVLSPAFGLAAVAEVLEAGSGLTPGIDFHLGSLAGGGPGTTSAGRLSVAGLQARLRATTTFPMGDAPTS